MNQIPILILSDAPDQTSGLARITRDLATLLSSTPEFRVGTLGQGGRGAQSFPWTQYHLYPNEFGELSLPYVWEDFAQGDRGIVFTINDLTRILWLARPEWAGKELGDWVKGMRGSGAFKLWSYVPIDSAGPNGKLTGLAKECLMGIDRVLAMSPFGSLMVKTTIGAEESANRGVDWLPHAVNTKIFKPKETKSEHLRIGCVMTNQSRKDWGLVAQIASDLVGALDGQVKFWWHVDTPVREWNLHALIEDFELKDYVEITEAGMWGDEWLADHYRACDLTILPSLGEGWGFPLFESLACGVPCLHVDYAGGASTMAAFELSHLLVRPIAWRLEGQQNCLRPVLGSPSWVEAVLELLRHPETGLHEKVQHLAMPLLGTRWQKWFRDGVQL